MVKSPFRSMYFNYVLSIKYCALEILLINKVILIYLLFTLVFTLSCILSLFVAIYHFLNALRSYFFLHHSKCLSTTSHSPLPPFFSSFLPPPHGHPQHSYLLAFLFSFFFGGRYLKRLLNMALNFDTVICVLRFFQILDWD